MPNELTHAMTSHANGRSDGREPLVRDLCLAASTISGTQSTPQSAMRINPLWDAKIEIYREAWLI